MFSNTLLILFSFIDPLELMYDNCFFFFVYLYNHPLHSYSLSSKRIVKASVNVTCKIKNTLTHFITIIHKKTKNLTLEFICKPKTPQAYGILDRCTHKQTFSLLTHC